MAFSGLRKKNVNNLFTGETIIHDSKYNYRFPILNLYWILKLTCERSLLLMMRPLPAKTLLLSFLCTVITIQALQPQAVNQAKQSAVPDSQLLNVSRDITSPSITSEAGVSASVTEKGAPVRQDKNLLTENCRVYPVPALNDLTVSGIENVSLLEVFDVTGKRIISEKCDGIEIKTLNISHLARGIYFIRLTTPLGAVMKRFVKE